MASTNVSTYPPPKPKSPPRLVSYKALIALLALGGVLGAGLFFLHGFQVKRNASALIQQADRAEEQGDVRKAVGYLQRYLALRPEDADVAARYALLRAPLAHGPRGKEEAFLALEWALRLNPDRQDVRRKCVELAVDPEVGRYSDARNHLETLLQAFPRDGELQHQLAKVEEEDDKPPKAKEAYAKAVELSPHNVDAWYDYAAFLRRRLDDEAGAKIVIADMIKANPDPPSDVEAQLAQVRYYQKFPPKSGVSREEVRKNLQDILQRLGKSKPEVLLLASDLELGDGNIDKAREYLRQGRQDHPEEVRFYQGLARLELQQGNRAAALERLREGVKHLPEQGEVVFEHLNLFIDAGAASEAESLLEKINREALPDALNQYVQARLRMQEKKWSAAAELLTRCRQELTRAPEMVKLIDLHLAECYHGLGNPDRQLAACAAALAIDPLWVPALLASAQAEVELGRTEQALADYERLLRREPAARPEQARLGAARLLVEGRVKLPDTERLQRAAELLDDAPASVKRSLDYRLLRLDLLAAQGKLSQAQKEAQALRDKNPKELRLWLALIRLAALQDQPDSIERLLGEAKRAVGPRPDLAVMRLRYLRGTEEAREADQLRKELAERVDAEPAEERAAWLRALADDALSQGDGPAAERLLSRLAEKEPQDVNVQVLLFDLALTRRDKPAQQAALAKLHALEGPEGAYWRYGEAVQILSEGRGADPKMLAQARTLLREAGKWRTSWSRILVAEGHLEEMEGNADRAIDKYKAALDRGERSMEVVGRLVALLNRQGRSTDAMAVLTRVQKEVPASSLLKKLEAETSLSSPRADPEQTLKLAREAVKDGAGGYRDHLWLGQVQWMLNHKKDAVKSLEKAVDLGKRQPETWVSLVLVQAQTDRKKAEKTIEAARKELPPDKAPLALAACYEVLGDRKRAEEYYEAALKERPNDPAVLRPLAEHHLNAGDLARAEPLLRQLIESEQRGSEREAQWARRTLALALTSAGGYPNSKQALRLIEENLLSRYASPADERAKALILALRPNGRREAIRTLEASFGRMPPSGDEQLLLAQLYEAEGDWARAREMLLGLVTREEKNATYLTNYVRGLLDHKNVEEAAFWLKKLEDLEKKNKSLPTVGLRAQLLHAQKKTDEAAKLLNDFAQTDPKNRGRQLGVGRLLDHIGRLKEAETIYRANLRAGEGKHLEDTFPLVMNLARQEGRLREALDLCEGLRGKVPPPVLAELCINALRATQPSEADCKRVVEWLKADGAGSGSSAVLDLGLANVRDLQGDQKEAEKIYQDVLERNPHNFIARNNLAMLLAVREGEGEKALEHIDKALEEAGHQAYLLDTRGLVHLALGQPELAVRDLEEATSAQPSPASFYRLARAHHLLRDRRAAAAAFRQAQNKGLKASDLHPLERADYEELAREYTERPER